MKQSRLKRHMRIDALDALLDNVLLPVITAMALVAFLWSQFQ